MISPFWAPVLLNAAVLLYCLVISLFVVPLVLERLTFYIPRLVLLARDKAVYPHSIALTIAEVLLWAAAVMLAYAILYTTFPSVFYMALSSPLALLAWALGAANVAYRHARFNRHVAQDFYHSAYMHYITPAALHAYQVFMEDLADMDDGELEAMSRLGRQLPHMHRLALRHKIEGRAEAHKLAEGAHAVGKAASYNIPPRP